MDSTTFIRILESSQNKILDGAAKDIMDWGKLKHNKECLELFLRHNVAVVYSESNGGETLVSSNLTYLGHLNRQRVQSNKSKVVKMMASSPKFASILKSRNPNIVRTWDLIENTKIEIPMDRLWSIQRWIGLNNDNIPVMSLMTNEILSKGKVSASDDRA